MTKRQKIAVKSGLAAGAVALLLGVGLGVGYGVQTNSSKKDSVNNDITNTVNGQVNLNLNQHDFLSTSSYTPIITIDTTVQGDRLTYNWYHNDKLVTDWTGITTNNQAPTSTILNLSNKVSNSGMWYLSIVSNKTAFNSNPVMINIYNSTDTSSVYNVSLSASTTDINAANTNKSATLTATVSLNSNITNYTDQTNKDGAYNLTYTYNLYNASTNTLLQTGTSTNTSYTFNVTNDTTTTYYVEVSAVVNNSSQSLKAETSNSVTINVNQNSDFSTTGSLSSNNFTPLLNSAGDVMNNTNITYSVNNTFATGATNTKATITYYLATTNTTNTSNATNLSSNIINTSTLKSSTNYYVFAKVVYSYTLDGNSYSGTAYTTPSLLSINSKVVNSGISISSYNNPIIYGNAYNANISVTSQTPSITISNNNNLTINKVAITSNNLASNVLSALNSAITVSNNTYSLDFAKLPSSFDLASLFTNNSTFAFTITYTLNGTTNTITSNAFVFQSLKSEVTLPNTTSVNLNSSASLTPTITNAYTSNNSTQTIYWASGISSNAVSSILNSYNSTTNTISNEATSSASYVLNTKTAGVYYVGCLVVTTYTGLNGQTVYDASNVVITAVTINADSIKVTNNPIYIQSATNTTSSYVISNNADITVSKQVTNTLPTWTLKGNINSASVALTNKALASYDDIFSFSNNEITVTSLSAYNTLLAAASKLNLTSIALNILIDGDDNTSLSTNINLNYITPQFSVSVSNSSLTYDTTSGVLTSPVTINLSLTNNTYYTVNSNFKLDFSYQTYTLKLNVGANTFSTLTSLLNINSDYSTIPTVLTLTNSTYSNLLIGFYLNQEQNPSLSVTNSTQSLVLPVLNNVSSSNYGSLINTSAITTPSYQLSFNHFDNVSAFKIVVTTSNSNLLDLSSYFTYNYETGNIVVNSLSALLGYLNTNYTSSLTSIPLIFSLYVNNESTAISTATAMLDLNTVTPEVNVTSNLPTGTSIDYNMYTNDDNFVTSNNTGISLAYNFSTNTTKYFNTSNWSISINSNGLTTNTLSTTSTSYNSISALFGNNYSALSTKVNLDTSSLNVVINGISFNLTNSSNPAFVLNPTSYNSDTATMQVSGNNSTNVTYTKSSTGAITITSDNYTSPTFNVSLKNSSGDVLDGYNSSSNYNVAGVSIDGTSLNSIASLKGSLSYNDGVLSINSSNYSTFLNTVAMNYLSANPDATSMPLTLDLVVLNTNNEAVGETTSATINVGLYGIVSTNENTTGYAFDISSNLANTSAFNTPILNLNLPKLPNGQSYSVTATYEGEDLSSCFELTNNQILVPQAQFSDYINTFASEYSSGVNYYNISQSNTLTFSIIYNSITYITYTYTQNMIVNPALMSYNNNSNILNATYNIVTSNINNQSNLTFAYTSIGKQLLNISAINTYLNSSNQASLWYYNTNVISDISDISVTNNGIIIPSSSLVALMQQGLTDINSSSTELSTQYIYLSLGPSASSINLPFLYMNLTPNISYNVNNSLQLPEATNTNIWNDSTYANYTFTTSSLADYIGDDLVVFYQTGSGYIPINIIPITSTNVNGSSFDYFKNNTILSTNLSTILSGVYTGITLMTPSQVQTNNITINNTAYNNLISDLTSDTTWTTYNPTFSLTYNISSISVSANGNFSTPLTITLTPTALTNKLYNLTDTLYYGGNVSAGLWSQLHTGTNTFTSLSDLFKGDAYLDTNGQYTSDLTTFLKNNAVFSYSLVGALYTKGLTSSSTQADITSAGFSANSSNSITLNFDKQ